MTSRQDKATTERFTRTLRELVKRPENKVCADCKRNDPRWASWNLGVFLCIRCSGIHRGMGTHISKVKSVDLDVWTAEQMESIQKWGNRLANLYWEAHLKAGHIPPEHKMESFVRSKYESRRWALEGPVPTDPSVLDDSPSPQQEQIPVVQQAAPAAPRQSTPAARQLLSTGLVNRPPPQASSPPVAAQPPPAAISINLHPPPAPAASPEVQKNVKQDILSLFSAQPTSQAAWGQQQPQQPAPQQQQAMMGTNGSAMWGANAWGASAGPDNMWPGQQNMFAQQQPNMFPGSHPNAFAAVQPNVFAASQPNAFATTQPNLFASSTDVWGSGTQETKKDDAFGDIWK
ncbi:hypothetical protein C8J56DRAFT_971560 [Mycena floridula]|nr:hypothetical protein C8J56DRAFT_971560 [Mycena floridula]